MQFSPTTLYIKRHIDTGLMYFGKTTRPDIEKYNGSGVYWKKHIAKHGKEKIETIWFEKFNDFAALNEFATFFSEFFNIAQSNTWANLTEETGISGGNTLSPEKRKIHMKHKCGIERSDEVKTAISESQRGKPRWSLEDKVRISKQQKDTKRPVRTEEHKYNLSKSHKNKATFINNEGNKIFTNKNDPRVLSGEYHGLNYGKKMSKEANIKNSQNKLGKKAYFDENGNKRFATPEFINNFKINRGII